MTSSLRSMFPPVYGPLLPEIFDRPEVVEERATCNTCTMCDQGQGSPVAMEFFNPETKCCTYHPSTPNYLVGAVFADEDPALDEGRGRFRAKIASRIGVTPMWLAPPRKMSLLIAAAKQAFGRSATLRCPYYATESGGCTVWRHRENVCSTYFCKHSKGRPGYMYWQAVKEYLGHTELSLATWAVRSIDPALREPNLDPARLTLEDLEDRAPRDADYASWWGAWAGREEELYRLAHDRVKGLTRAEFARIVDDTEAGRRQLDKLRRLWDGIDNTIVPARLVRNNRMIETHLDESVVVTTYNPFDSFKLDKDLFEVLGLLVPYESLEQNLARLRDEHGIELEPELLRHLHTHGVLLQPSDLGISEAKPGAATAGAAHAHAHTHAHAAAEGGRAPSKLKRSPAKKRRR